MRARVCRSERKIRIKFNFSEVFPRISDLLSRLRYMYSTVVRSALCKTPHTALTPHAYWIRHVSVSAKFTRPPLGVCGGGGPFNPVMRSSRTIIVALVRRSIHSAIGFFSPARICTQRDATVPWRTLFIPHKHQWWRRWWWGGGYGKST